MLVCWGRYISKEENRVVTEQTVGQKCRLVQNKMLQMLPLIVPKILF